MGEEGATSHAGLSDRASVAAAAPRRRPPSTGLTLPLLAALIVGVIASFGVAILGTMLTEPLASAPAESGPYVKQPDGTMTLARGWLWPAPKEWGTPEHNTVHRTWIAVREQVFGGSVPALEMPRDHNVMATTSPDGRVLSVSRFSQQRFSCGWPVTLLQVRDPPFDRSNARSFSLLSCKFEYYPAQSTLLIFPPSSHGNGFSIARDMPTRVHWPGLAFNTLFFGVLFLVMFILPGRAKIARRRRFGLCLACGYDLAGLATCPECGLAASREMPAHAPAAPSPVP